MLSCVSGILFLLRVVGRTLLSRMRWIMTMLHSTTNVSTALEKVCVWYVQVTYEEATRTMADVRRLGDGTSSCIAQSSSTKLKMNIMRRRV